MHFRLLLCCFGKDYPDSDLKAAAHSLSPPYTNERVTVDGKKVVKGFPLCVNVLEGVQQGEVVYITPEGLASFKETRPVKFGSGQEADFRLSADEGIGALHFQISYRTDLGEYQLTDLGGEAGIFVKLDFTLTVPEEGVGITFGETFADFAIGGKGQLIARFLDGEKAGKTMEWGVDEAPIQVGRIADCDLQLEDISLSRYQCLLTYHRGHWKVLDGDGQKPSTNGTWIYVKDSFPLHGRVSFKAGSTLFEAVSGD